MMAEVLIFYLEEVKMKVAKYLQCSIIFCATTMMGSAVYASGDHKHSHDNDISGGHQEHAAMTKSSNGMFLKKENIDGYEVSFHVMKAKPGKEMGGSHDFMIKVEKDGKAQKNIIMNTKVVYPDGKAESKKTMKMGDWLMAGYDLGQMGKHQLLILFKTADGQKHKGGVYYPGQ